MKYFTLLPLILILSATFFAQTPPVATATPVGEVKESWQFFAPAGEGFTLDAPGEITPGYINEMKDNTIKTRFYMTFVGGVRYYMFSDVLDKPVQNQRVLTFVDSQAPGLQPNEIYSFGDKSGYHHKVLVLKNEERIYTFQTVSPNKDDASIRRFFESIRVKNNLQRPAEKTALQNLAGENSSVSMSCQRRETTSPISAATPPTGDGIGTGASKNIDPTSATTENIKILSKPRANYTDYARFYQIQGSVQVKATFPANGQMGNVTAVTKVPFGLTEQALQAACGLTFTPAMKNGVPYTVIKQVIYNFTLY